MRNNYIVNIIIGLSIALFGLAACKGRADKQAHTNHTGMHRYTCPKHPHIVSNHPGKCPVCGADLIVQDANRELVIDSNITALTQPVNARVIAAIPVIKPDSGLRIYAASVSGVITYDTRDQTSIASRVGGRIERLLIKYNYQPVKKGQLIMEIYSPDLAAAQRELLQVASSNPDMIPAAKQRLLFLGMQPAQVEQVLRKEQILYRVPVYSNSNGYILEQAVASSAMVSSTSSAAGSGSGGGMNTMEEGSPAPAAVNTLPSTPATTPVLIREGQYVAAGQSLFTIYKADHLLAEFAFPSKLASNIKQGQKLLFYPVNNKNEIHTGSIGLLEPVYRSGQYFMLARVYLHDHHFNAGRLLMANVPLIYNSGWWVPKKAVWRLGNKSIVFKKSDAAFVPVPVETGVETTNMIQINTNISDWKIAANAAYLVDSESFIKIAGRDQ